MSNAPNSKKFLVENAEPGSFYIPQRLALRGRVCLRVQGSSMLPWVRPGDLAVIRMVPPGSIRPGNLVLFQRTDRLFVHRVVSRASANGTSFVVKGDANPHPDGVLEPHEILGRVERIYRRGRTIEFHSPRKRALDFLIAQISRYTGFWFALVRLRGIATVPARRLLRVLRPSRAVAR